MITVIVGRRAVPLRPNLVDDFDQAVHQTDDLFAKLLDGLRKLLDAAHCEDNVDLATGDLQLHEILIVSQSPRHDLRAFLTEASLEQITNFVNGLLQHLGLQLEVLLFVFFVWLRWHLQWLIG